ncbi:hypothetical protein J1TS1_28120 [Shouchella clausii]|jgi:hypothetical protein|uniref:hypothetical protein n=1 Tax=Shouchella clausii TaxID=79880 RepID=UPI001B044FB7|nr:hypothetical protein [Shouchella clausii]MBU8598493.1 hypothetical protein [Shouchella clausii]GIN08667.1 hypothetical protein J1TS1_28120 [Shouchella clausii]
MPYLTFEEFESLTEKTTGIEEEEFKNLLPKASAILDNVTSHFYHRRDIEKDNKWRVRQFKLGLCAQIEYFHVLGSTTFEEINNAPQTFQAGRTSVSNASRYNPSGANESKPLVAEDVFIYLEGTGLLYAGVAVW